MKNNEAKYTVVFDGTCNLCNGWIRIIQSNANGRKFNCISLHRWLQQAEYQVDPQLESIQHSAAIQLTQLPDSVLLIHDGKVFTQSTAVLIIARELSGSIRCLLLGYVLPRFIRDAIYRWIARNRYRWFGKSDNCAW